MDTPKTGSFCWFDLPTTDDKKSMAFYKSVLSWNFKPMSPTYWMIEVDGNTIGGLNVLTKPNFKPAVGFVPYFTVPSVKEGCGMITKAGGSLVGPTVAITNGEMGYFQQFTDIDGNTVAIWSMKP